MSRVCDLLLRAGHTKSYDRLRRVATSYRSERKSTEVNVRQTYDIRAITRVNRK